jgi:hypothetical protein
MQKTHEGQHQDKNSLEQHLFANNSTLQIERKLCEKAKVEFIRKYEKYYGRNFDVRARPLRPEPPNNREIDYGRRRPRNFFGCFRHVFSIRKELTVDLGKPYQPASCEFACRANSTTHTVAVLFNEGHCFCGARFPANNLWPRLTGGTVSPCVLMTAESRRTQTP